MVGGRYDGAGVPYATADPPPAGPKGYRSDPSPSAMPRGTFPDGGLAFRLPTPLDKGIGVQVNCFRPPETHPFRVVQDERAGNFARGRGACLHYRHMQQSAKYLVPSFPTQSRVDELNRIHSDARKHEMQRTLMLESLEENEKRRQFRLRQAKAMLRSKDISKEVSQKLQASMSLPDLNEPCGEQTPVLQLLNRRVDVNRIKKCRSQMALQQKAEVVKQAVVVTPELKELLDDIDRFEGDNLPELNMILETVVDWKNSTSISWAQEP